MASDPEQIEVALVGLGVYGNVYLDGLSETKGASLVAIADPKPSTCQKLPELRRRQVPIYGSLEELQKHHRPSLTILCSPPHLHCEQTIQALRGGSHVLCEKPLCSSPQQAQEMIRARDEAGLSVSVGYQWSFSHAIQSLKRDILAGLFGRPRHFKTIVLWPRDEMYYRRNDWAGRRYSAAKQPIFDSPLNNACAHHLHNMMYLLGDAIHTTAAPATVIAETYRAYPIEMFDTLSLRVTTSQGVELDFIASHASERSHGPMFQLEFEEGSVIFVGEQPTPATRDGSSIFARFNNGRVKHYGSPEKDPFAKLHAAVRSIQEGVPTVCGIEASIPQTLVTAAVHQSEAEAVTFPAEMVRYRDEKGRWRSWVVGLDDTLFECYQGRCMPHEMGVPWAVAGEKVQIDQILRLPVATEPTHVRRRRKSAQKTTAVLPAPVSLQAPIRAAV
jgi:predicted dehydrogenase